MPIAALQQVGIRREASFASGGSVDSWQPVRSSNIEKIWEPIYGDRIQATRKQIGSTLDRTHVTGSIEFGISPQGPEEWWRCGLGGSSSPYTPATTTLESLLIQERSDDVNNLAIQASGCMVGSMTLGSSEGEELTCSLDIEGVDAAQATPASATWVSGDAPFVHSECTFKLNGVSDNDIRSWSVTINNNLATDLYGASQKRQEIPATKLQVEGTFTKLFLTSTERTAFLAAGIRSFQATYNRGANSFDVLLTKIRYNTRPENLGGQTEYINEEFGFTAYADDSTNDDVIKITVV